jgi:hypothetical protein
VRNRALLGMLTPSSNSVLESVSSAKVAEAPEISVHFGRRNLLAFVRIDGSKFLSVDYSIRKAITAVYGRAPTGNVQGRGRDKARNRNFRKIHQSQRRLRLCSIARSSEPSASVQVPATRTPRSQQLALLRSPGAVGTLG